MVLAALYRETIIHWLQPHKVSLSLRPIQHDSALKGWRETWLTVDRITQEEIVATSCTWLVPIAILVVLSIPPLVSSFVPSSAGFEPSPNQFRVH